MLRVLHVLLIALVVFAFSGVAAPITSGNILISTSEVLYEYTIGGVFVQSFPIPDGSGAIPNPDTARDAAMKTGTDQIHVFNGTFSPSLSTLDATTSLWTHQTFAGWSTVNNVSYGGIAVGGRYVFVTDMNAGLGGEPLGVVRFDSGGSTLRFATGINPIDLNIGHDGLLYVLDGQFVYVYDPDSLALQQTIDLDSVLEFGDYRSVAVNASGQMFIVDWDGNLYKTDSSGNSILSTNLSGIAEATTLTDVDVSDSGTVVVGDSAGGVTVTDEAFTSPSSFSVGSSPIFIGVPANPPVGLPISQRSLYILAGVLLAVAAATVRVTHARRRY
jgi:hypothetical protein